MSKPKPYPNWYTSPYGKWKIDKTKMAYNLESKPSSEAWEKEEFISLGMGRLNLKHR